MDKMEYKILYRIVYFRSSIRFEGKMAGADQPNTRTTENYDQIF